MKKYFLLFTSLLCSAITYSQSPKIEVYTGAGLFNTKLSRDSLIPPDRMSKSRLGDVSSFGLQFGMPLLNKHWTIKGGMGYTVRHYSLNKYSTGDFFSIFFIFGPRPRSDTFHISYLRFTNKYLQVPLSVAYTISRNNYNAIKFTTGLQLRSDFLLSSSAAPQFDSSVFVPMASDFARISNAYTGTASKYMLTIEPFIQGDFIINKNWGVYMQLRPLSFYTSKTDKKLTTANAELLGIGFGAFYTFTEK